MAILLTSKAFEEGSIIPRNYTCDGQDLSPPLSLEGVPEATESLVLIMDDPDAPRGTWVHWILFNIPPDAQFLPEGISLEAAFDDGSRQGKNDFGRLGYGGPCPPPGKRHRYFFRLYALRKRLDLPAGASRAEVDEAIFGWILDQGELMGTYSRQ